MKLTAFLRLFRLLLAALEMLLSRMFSETGRLSAVSSSDQLSSESSPSELLTLEFNAADFCFACCNIFVLNPLLVPLLFRLDPIDPDLF